MPKKHSCYPLVASPSSRVTRFLARDLDDLFAFLSSVFSPLASPLHIEQTHKDKKRLFTAKRKEWSRVARSTSFRSRGPVGSSSSTHPMQISLSRSFAPFYSPRGYFLVRKGRKSVPLPHIHAPEPDIASKFAAFRLLNPCLHLKGFPACCESAPLLFLLVLIRSSHHLFALWPSQLMCRPLASS